VRSYGEIEKIIVDDLERATTRFREESVRFSGLMQDVPSGIPQPDGSLRVQQSSAAYKKALADPLSNVTTHSLSGGSYRRICRTDRELAPFRAF